MRATIIHILHIEDNALDAQLIQHGLEEAQFQFQLKWVDNFADFKEELETNKFDLILADYSYPDCDGMDVLRLAKELAPFTPVILVTGALGEEMAIDTIKAGVVDYVLKTNLLRLQTAVPNAIRAADDKREKLLSIEALKQSEERFDLAVRGSGAGIWDWQDVTSEQMWWSPRIYEMLGYQEGEVPATRSQLYSMIPDADVAYVKAEMDAHFTEQKPYDTEFRIKNKHGQQLWLRSRGKAIIVAGKQTRMAGYIQDVTDRKRAQETLRVRQRDLLQAQEIASIGSWTYYVKQGRFQWTPIVFRIFGYSASEFKGTMEQVMARVHPEDRELVENQWKHALKSGRFDYEHRLQVDGETRWVREVAEIEYDHKGQPIKALGVVHDLTAQRKAEKDRLLADERYRAITESAHDAIVVINEEGNVVFWNPASERIFGFSEDEVLGKNLHQEMFHKDDEPDNCLCSSLKAGIASRNKMPSAAFEMTVMNKNGHEVTVEMNTTAMEQEGCWYGLGIIRDVTERQQLEQQLRQTQKMEAIGTLAGGIAHDFNNILASILGYASMVERKLPASSPEKEDMAEVLNAAERAKQLVRQILTFSRKSETEKVPVFVDMVIKEVLRLLRASLPSTIEVKTNIEAAGETILGDVTQVHQILMNLCTNAYHAMPAGGLLCVTLKKVCIAEADSLAIDSGDYLEIKVSDTGVGIPEEILDHVFDPYFTTKDVDTGTGLGLSVVRGIIDSLNGCIEVESTPDEGTCFRILLPHHSGNHQLAEKQEEAVFFDGSQKVLLVDDEEALARIWKEYLEEMGCETVIKTCAVSAMDEIENNPEEYDLVITDQTMPKLTGIELSQKLFQVNPKIPVILCSGMKLSLESEGVDKTSICHVSLKTELLDELPSLLKDIFEK